MTASPLSRQATDLDIVDPADPRAFLVSPFTRIAVALILAVSIALATVRATLATGTDPSRPEIVDFHPFYLAGRLALEGHFADSYQVPLMRALEKAFGGGRDVWMPFVYPPSFGLIMAPLSMLPVGLAFLLFTVATLAFYLAVMRRLAGVWFWPATLAMSPALMLDIQVGQNGLLTGGVAGLSVALVLGGRSGPAGLAAGVLAFKPQLATFLPLLFMLRREGLALAVAAASALAITALAVMTLGVDTIAGFLSSTSVVAGFMAAGSFPLHRMVSVYACALSLGIPAGLALALHGAVAFVVAAVTMAAGWRLSNGHRNRPADPKSAAGLTLMATAFVSPYFFDYDLPIFGAGLALLLPALARGLTPRALAIFLAVVAAVGILGLLGPTLSGLWDRSVSLGAPILVTCFLVALATLLGRGPKCDAATPVLPAAAVA